MGGREKRRKLRLSKIYTYACGRSSLGSDRHEEVGGPGFSRVVFCNEPNSSEAALRNYATSYVSTTKYTIATFIPKSLFEQFRRVANLYFLLAACLGFTRLSPYSGVSSMVPLSFVILVSMIKEAIEDWKRFKQVLLSVLFFYIVLHSVRPSQKPVPPLGRPKGTDLEVNNRKVKVHLGDGSFGYTEWKQLKVGDVVKVEKDGFFPADLLLLSSIYDDAICYVETMNLDGETNLKLKQALEVTSGLSAESNFQQFKAMVKCEDPNANLYSFVGSMNYGDEQYPLSPQQVLLRDSKLRNTDYIFGVVIFTGHDTKVIQNSTEPPSKRSKVEKKMDKIIYYLFSLLVVISACGSVFFGIWTKQDIKNGRMKRWYLRPDDATMLFDPKKAGLAAFFHFLTALMLYNYFIPISLYVSIEIVKILQCIFINQDQKMYYEEYDRPAHARTSNLNEELGQVDTVLSDKTGTLTCNSMEFLKCSVAGVAYGHGITEVERAMAKRKGSPISHEISSSETDDENVFKPSVKGFNFTDDRIMNGNWIHEPHSDVIQKFFRVLAICQTAIPEVNEESGKVTYEAESPDEAAFVIAAREVGFKFFKRTQTSISLHELDPVSGEEGERSYELLNVIEFNSSRKRMSVIVKNEENQILLLSKGADSVMFERLSEKGRKFEDKTREQINEYADAGLRTLVLAYRELDEAEYKNFSEEFFRAKNSVSADRDEKVDEVADKIERDLILLGATAVEDKLQQGVPECIDKLAQAGIKIWVLTGDKMETAINIGFACSLLRQGMEQIIITLDTPEIKWLEKQGDKYAIAKASKASIVKQINEGKSHLVSSVESTDVFALIIDGKALAFALEEDVKSKFLELAIGCASVICCRSSPKQKALVTRLVKEGTGKTTLAIGDGANDVGMLQEADIGVGISGVEGMQAVMSSDVAIAQFCFLERLLLVHGHWCYRRITSMICYFFYKNMVFGFTLFLYEIFASFSGQAAYNDWFMSTYNVFFTSLPVIALGIFDQDVSARLCLQFPLLYQEGVQNMLFSWRRIFSWMLNGVYSAAVVFFFTTSALQIQAFRRGGELASRDVLGTMMYTCIVWIVNCQMALAVSYFTWMHLLFVWGSITFWYLFLLVYGSITPTFSTTAYKIFIEACGPAPSYWVITFFVAICALIPYVVYSTIQMKFFPMYHELILWIRLYGKGDPDYGEMLKRKCSRRSTVGYSARREAKAYGKKKPLHKKREKSKPIEEIPVNA